MMTSKELAELLATFLEPSRSEDPYEIAAHETRRIYDAFRAEGFTDDQTMKLISAFIFSTCRSDAGEED